MVDDCSSSDVTDGDASVRLHFLIALAVVGLATAALGVWQIGHQGFWPDEAFSARVAMLEPQALRAAVSQSDSFTALYFGLLYVWQAWGHDEAWLRLLSVLFGVAGALVLLGLNLRVFGLPTALAASALLIGNAFFVRFMQEARPYTLAVFLVVLASFCFVKALDAPTRTRWTVYAVVGALAIYAHFFSGFVLLALLSSLVVRHPRPRSLLVGYAHLLMALLVTPLAWLMLTTDPLERPFIPKPRLASLLPAFLHLTGGGGLPSRDAKLLLLAYFLVCSGAVFVMGRATMRTRRHRRRLEEPGPSAERSDTPAEAGWRDGQKHSADTTWSHTLVLLWLAVPVLGSFALSFIQPVFYPRYLIVVLPSLVTIAAIGICGLPSNALRVLVVAALLVASSRPLLAYYRTPIREGGDWKGAVTFLAEAMHPGDGVVFLSRYARGPIEYYRDWFPSLGHLVPIYPQQPWGHFRPILDDRTTASTAVAAEYVRTVPRVWCVLLWGGFDSHAEDGAPLRVALDRAFRSVARYEFGPSLEIRLYERHTEGSDGSGPRAARDSNPGGRIAHDAR